jgi:class 3 adenylate cyclase
MPAGAFEALLRGVVEDWESAGTFARQVPSLAENERMRHQYAAARRLQASPTTATELYRSFGRWDVTAALPFVQCPTLVLQVAGAYVIRIGHGRYLGAHIPGAKYVQLEGHDSLWWGDCRDAFIDEVEGFLTGVRKGPESDRVLATVVFTDLVGSTERAAALGDRLWRALLNDHDVAARRLLDAFNGRLVKSIGDGTLATFDGPTRAVRFALAMRDSVRELGVEMRCGVHTGEVERRGEDVGGLAVHLAARVQGVALPGQVLVSRTVADLVVGSGILFEDQGEHELKGVPGTWRLFSVEA